MTRRNVFDSYKTHAWLKRVYARLNAQELELAHNFIESHATLSKNDFMAASNRMFMDREKPKNYTAIMELISCAGSGATDQ